jgi:hypothetical protein
MKRSTAVRRRVFAMFASLLAGCASVRWPDEPGVPVATSCALNARIGDEFLDQLTIRRTGRAMPAPIVTPRYQKTLRLLADKLQEGAISVQKAQDVSEEWARRVYHGRVDTWVLDCDSGREMWIPSDLVTSPAAVISYAVARFRPRSLPTDQCAIIVVNATAGDRVVSLSPGPP